MSKQFNIGDRVTFKTWDEMEEEFETQRGTTGTMIDCIYGFVPDMAPLCNTQATIAEDDTGYGLLLKDFSAEGGDAMWANTWVYSTDMVKQYGGLSYDKSRADTIKEEQTEIAKEILEIVREELAIARESETITPRVKYYLGNVIGKICKRFDINLEEE